MTGEILKTHLGGGFVRSDDGRVSLFRWNECEFKPVDVGRGVRVQFYAIVHNGRDIATALKRAK